MSMMESYLLVACPAKGCNLHVDLNSHNDLNSVDTCCSNDAKSSSSQYSAEPRLSESKSERQFGVGQEYVAMQVAFWQDKIAKTD